MRGKDPLRVLAAAYTLDGDGTTWLERLLDALTPYDLGGGLAAYTSTLGDTVAIEARVNRTKLPTDAIDALARELPPDLYRRLHAPMPLTDAADLFPRASAECGYVADWADFPGRLPVSAWAVAGGDPNVESTLITFHAPPGTCHSGRDRATLDRIGAHVGSALRLRAFFAGAAPHADDPLVDAVLAPDGTVLDARGPAREEAPRRSLVDAITRKERARLRRATNEERLAVWTALVEGRWSVVETTERDGKRLLLAVKNDPRGDGLRNLTARERDVARYVALGHSIKYVAYELGVSTAVVGVSLDRALRKLGVATRADLVGLFVRLAQPPK